MRPLSSHPERQDGRSALSEPSDLRENKGKASYYWGDFGTQRLPPPVTGSQRTSYKFKRSSMGIKYLRMKYIPFTTFPCLRTEELLFSLKSQLPWLPKTFPQMIRIHGGCKLKVTDFLFQLVSIKKHALRGVLQKHRPLA